MTTYTVAVGAENAEQLASPMTELAANSVNVQDLGGGRISFGDHALEWLRSYPAEDDGHVSEDDGRLQMWIGGVPYPVESE